MDDHLASGYHSSKCVITVIALPTLLLALHPLPSLLASHSQVKLPSYVHGTLSKLVALLGSIKEAAVHQRQVQERGQHTKAAPGLAKIDGMTLAVLGQWLCLDLSQPQARLAVRWVFMHN